jgi:predicted protein tyrosine phosphatase
MKLIKELTVQSEIILGVISKSEYLEAYHNNEFNRETTALIAIHNPGVPHHSKEDIKGICSVHELNFWDIQEPIGHYSSISTAQSIYLSEFIVDNINKQFIVHCDYGHSRSAGVALAIECIYYSNADRYSFFRDNRSHLLKHERYEPNMAVFDKIIEATLPPVL